MLTGCDIVDGDAAEERAAQDFRIQRRRAGGAVHPNKLAPTYPESAITRPFPFNAYYSEDEAPEVDGDDYKLEVAGPGRQQEALDAGRAQRAAAGDADHPPHLRRGLERDRLLAGRALSEFLKRIGADTRAKYVWFKCAEGYTNTIDMPTALHPQTQMTLAVTTTRRCRAPTASR